MKTASDGYPRQQIRLSFRDKTALIVIGDYVSIACFSTDQTTDMQSGDKGFVVTMMHQTGNPEIVLLQGVEAKSKNEFVLLDKMGWDYENSTA